MDIVAKRFVNTLVLSPAGRLDHAATEGFTGSLLAHVATCRAGQDLLVLDLSGVPYIASVGLRALMIASKQAKAQGGTLVLAALQPVVQEIFEISRFTVILTIFPSVRAALAALSSAALQAFDTA
ncbi:MAG TPA: STAS domain-containing protein [Candidatus Methylomirabilis sp.]|nr:STAS domain-containing protein [Candidatus Methylomirabilis sp.]